MDVTGQERFSFAMVADVVIAETTISPRTLAVEILDEGITAVLAGDGSSFQPLAFSDELRVKADLTGDVGGDAGRSRVVDQEPALKSL